MPERHPWTEALLDGLELAAVESVCAKAIPAASTSDVSNIFFMCNSLFLDLPLGRSGLAHPWRGVYQSILVFRTKLLREGLPKCGRDSGIKGFVLTFL